MNEPGLVTHTPSGTLIKHGGAGTAYASYGCRCFECTEANRERGLTASRRRREQTKKGLIPDSVQHGTVGAYRNWGCRCEECKVAGMAGYTSYYHRVMSAEARFKSEMEAYERGKMFGEKPLRKRDMRPLQPIMQEFVRREGRLPRARSKDLEERRLANRFWRARGSKEEWAVDLYGRFKG